MTTHYEDRCTVDGCPQPNSEEWHRCFVCGRQPIDHQHFPKKSLAGKGAKIVAALCRKHHDLLSLNKWREGVYTHPDGSVRYYVQNEKGEEQCERIIEEAPARPEPVEGRGLASQDGTPLVPAVKEPATKLANADDVIWKETSLEFKPSVSYERWVEIRDALKRMEGALSWWWGDWCNYGERAYGEKYSQALEESGLAYQTLRNRAYVCERFDLSRRRDNLNFELHETVASIEGDQEQDRWLDIAQEKHLKLAQFRQTMRLAKMAKRMAELSPVSGTFRTIVADPPWPYEDTASRGAAEDHYETLALDDISYFKINERPVSELAPADGAHLYLWTPSIHLAEGWAAKIARAWGFEPKVVITWIKPQVGVGNWFRSATEHVLFCTRENLPLAVQDEAVINWFEASRRKHSEKPDEFYELVRRVSPGPWLDLFARTQRDGWTCWGDEVGEVSA